MSIELADQVAIADVLARYCQTCDDGRFEELVELFTADGVFDYAGRIATGRAGLLAFFTEVQTPERRGKHLVSNAVVQVGGDRATVRSDWIFLGFVDGVLTPKLTGRYDDVLVRTAETWLLAERVVTTMVAPHG